MRHALGMALLLGVSVVGLIAAWEWLVKKLEPSDEKRKSRNDCWLLWQSGVVREREK